ncbi:MAG: BrnA antitoxin family protein [Syntrophales bacterium LBB04]|nr:BrnA antitoxin family protein [Syntrophales bacterium LBB04]
MRKNKVIPDMSIYEATLFWDEHDFTEFEDVQETRELQFQLIKKKYIGVDMSLYAKVRKHARKLKISEEALIHQWLGEKAKA